MGVRPGTPLAHARALFTSGDVRIKQYDPAGDRAALRHLAIWAQRLSPVVAVDDSHEDPDGLLLDVTGCDRVWGGEERLAHAALDGLVRLGFAAKVAIAPTFGCAWAVSRSCDKPVRILTANSVHEALAPLPIESLRVPPDVVMQLAEIGVDRIGHLLELPRSALPARFGPELLLRLDQALGQAIETIEPIRPAPPPAVDRVFDGPTDRIEAIELTVRELLASLASELEQHESGARRIDVELIRSDLGPECLSVTLGRPSRDAKHLWQLLRPKLGGSHLGFGVEAVRVCASVVGRIRHEQAECAGAAGEIARAKVKRSCDELLDTLRNRLGEGRVLRAELRESYLPESAFAMRGVSDPGSSAGCVPNDRPTVLLDRPSPAEIIALTPDGPVHRVTWRGEERETTVCLGPERIGGEWWRAADRTRDYFAVRDDQGRWLWLVRGVERGRWFVHGVWA